MTVELNGSYSGNIKLDLLFPTSKTNKVLINVHGLYGLSGNAGSKSELLGEKIIEKGIAQVAQYNSSRDWNTFKDGDWDKMQSAFENKTFEDELNDARTTLCYLVQQELEIYALGNSLGGMVLSSVCSEYPQITKLILAGSGTGATTSKLPVMNTMSPDIIKKSAEKFSGEVLLIQGSDDDVVPLVAGDELLTFFDKAARRDKVVIEGAPHNFKGFYDEYIEEIVKFIS